MENLKIGSVLFNGDADDNNSYQLAININNVVYVRRNFNKDLSCQDTIPSGWPLHHVQGLLKLCIDNGQQWFVNPTQEAWDDLLTLKR